MLRRCPKCQAVLTGADSEIHPFEAKIMVKGGHVPIGYDSHQDVLFVMATKTPVSDLLGADGQPVAHMKIGRYVNIERLSEELRDAVMQEVRSRLPTQEKVVSEAQV